MKSPSATAFAPATIGNVGVGFDILGMAIKGVGDAVHLKVRKDTQVVIQSLSGVEDSSLLPTQADKNTASAALLALQKGEKIKFGFDVWIHKGIPMGSGMGGSAASAVSAIVAANQLLKKKLSYKQKLFYSLEGEKVASGASHPDNVAPCLHGGIVLACLSFQEPVIALPFPKTMGWVLVHPNLKVETKQARAILEPSVALEKYVTQTAHLSCFISGFYKKDLNLIKQGFHDFVIEPQRSTLIPGFDKIKKRAMLQKGVLGFSLSGSGPSVFAFTQSLNSAQKLAKIIQAEFMHFNLESQAYFGEGPCSGAHIMSDKKVKDRFPFLKEI